MRNFVSFFLLFAATCTAGFAAAQNSGSQTIDIEAIRASAKAHEDEAEALAENIRTRSEAVRDDARRTQDRAKVNRERYANSVVRKRASKKVEVFDFDAMIADQADMAKAEFRNAPRFIAFASLSMPPASLKTLVHDMAAAGGITVLRGFPKGSAKELTRALTQIATKGEELPSLGIDPRLFRAFAIKAAPSFVIASSDFTLCDGFDCVGAVPPHDRISGNVTVKYALETFARGGGPGSQMSRLHLKRLNGSHR